MNIVIDTSVIIAVIADEPEKENLIRLTKGAQLIAPASVHWEIGNAFSAMFKRKLVTLTQAQKALSLYPKIPITFVDVELDKSLELAHQLNIYAYDAYLMQCALKHHSPLISLDRRLVRYAKQKNITVLEVSL